MQSLQIYGACLNQRPARIRLERAMGIEPTALAWEARVLPLYDARLVVLERGNPLSRRAL